MKARDELILSQLKSDVVLYRGLFIFCGLAAIGCLIGMVPTFLDKDWSSFAYLLASALSVGGIALNMRSRSNSAAKALKEIGPNAEDLDQYHDFSPTTMKALRGAQYTKSEYMQLFIAYTIVGLMLLAMGIVFVVLLTTSIPILALIGLGLALFGLVLTISGLRAFSSWRIMNRIESSSTE